ncbi:MAG: hypothetical protein F4Y98_03180 [Chloroflexi bacterium]|nr:hypothetical protein [Chloroflexota bacterium]
MPTHGFRLIVEGPDVHETPLPDALYASGCDDALVGSIDEAQYLDFTRVAPTIDEAIRSAIADVESVDGIKVVGVNWDRLDL